MNQRPTRLATVCVVSNELNLGPEKAGAESLVVSLKHNVCLGEG